VRRPLADDLADQILDDVLAGRYPVGTALPSESELAEASDLSRATVREAVKTLQSKGVLRRRDDPLVRLVRNHHADVAQR